MLEVSQNLIQTIVSDVPGSVEQSSQIVQVIVDIPPPTVEATSEFIQTVSSTPNDNVVVQNGTDIVQVLIGTLPFATDTLVFTESAVVAADSPDIDENLNLTETVDEDLFIFVLQDPVEETLNLTETATAEVSQDITEMLTISESNSVDIDLVSEVEETLELSETAVAFLEISIETTDNLTLGEPNGDLGTFDFQTNTFTPEDSGLRDSAIVEDLPVQDIEENLRLVEDPRGWVISPGPVDPASDNLIFTEIARVAVESDGVDSLVFSETNQCEVTQDVREVLQLDEIADSCLDSSSSVVETLNLNEGFTVCHVTAFDRCGVHRQFAPQAGSSTLQDYPQPQTTKGFRLQSPAGGPVVRELILVNPNLGNIDRLSPTRVNVESRGGSLIIFSDPIWPNIETKLYTFSNMKREMAHALLDWLCEMVGLEIRLIDHEDRLWRGIITQPGDPIVEDRRGRYTGSFEFEGELVE